MLSPTAYAGIIVANSWLEMHFSAPSLISFWVLKNHIQCEWNPFFTNAYSQTEGGWPPAPIPPLQSAWPQNLWVFLTASLSLPGKRWQLHGNTLNASGYSHDLTLTKHKRLNLDRRPCEEDPAYNFTVCVKENLSEKVSCRLPWDKWSQQKRSVCTSEEQFNQFELLYSSLLNAEAEVITERTGCKIPCNYKEYKFVESSPNPIPNPQSVAFWAASHKTHIEEEVLIYPFTSLVAEFGGSLGLFLGFSFITIWHEIRGYFCSA